MKNWLVSLRMLVFWSVVLGIVYPLLMTVLAQASFPRESAGSLIEAGGHIVGSKWIEQKFSQPQYFWGRPSAVDFNALSSGGSNAGPIAESLKASSEDASRKLKAAHLDQVSEPPQDLIFASASGLDPHISPEGALYQLNRVANARKMKAEDVRKLVGLATEAPQFGFLGDARVNVLKLNLSLDEQQSHQPATMPAQ